ncbi:MAG TPA: pitrilysin family protein [Anaerolineaceae bacterium]|nr:pitrilysin family protein [Anaerolineaceae bacterium]
MPDAYHQFRLSNGLLIQLKEIHTAPIISHWVWYRVGSRFEQPGKTGISHWVEHMQFKGTPRFPSGVLDKAISREGGYWNAFTYLDWTTYFETMPAHAIDLALESEADRMFNSIYTAEEVESERTVVISEREGNENEPLFRLGVAIQAASFDSHPYRNEIIGTLADLHAITRDDLYQHYRTHYAPNNAVVAVAGDFDTAQMLHRLESIYGILMPSDVPPAPRPVEPDPTAEKQVEVSGPGETTFVQLAYRAPAAREADFFAFTVLDSLLTGPTSLNMFGGGGISNKTSRLYRALVERELAVGVGGSLQATHDPFTYDITITVHPNQTPELVLQAVDVEIQKLQQAPVKADEITRAIKQARALFAYGSENITNQAFWLGYAEMFDHYDWFLNYMERLEQITPADVQRVAQTCLLPTRRVVGIYRPTGTEEPE